MLSNYEIYVNIQEEEKDRFHNFMSDDRGVGKWTEEKDDLLKMLRILLEAKTPVDKLIAVDRVLNYVHVSGPFADIFVEGGKSTLDYLKNR